VSASRDRPRPAPSAIRRLRRWRDDLAAIPAVIRLSRRARRVVTANLVIAAAIIITALVTWDLAGSRTVPPSGTSFPGRPSGRRPAVNRFLAQAALPRPQRCGTSVVASGSYLRA